MNTTNLRCYIRCFVVIKAFLNKRKLMKNNCLQIIKFLLCLIASPSLSFSSNTFIENKGQVCDNHNNPHPEILFYAQQHGTNVFLRNNGLSYVLEKPAMSENKENLIPNENEVDKFGHRIDVDFINAKQDPAIICEKTSAHYFNYYYEQCPSGISNVKSFEKIIYQNVYSNIDVHFYNNAGKGFKYDLMVNPGGNPNDIKLKYNGAEKLKIENEKLIIETSLGELIESIPKVYQEVDGVIIDVKAEYVLNGTTVNFKLSNFRTDVPLVIDPWVTYLGGSGADQSFGLDVDNNGNAIVVGQTASTVFPSSVGAFQAVYGGNNDAFISKLNANGNLLFTTYYGGNQNDVANGVIVNNSGDIFIAGTTLSTGLSTAGSLQPVKGTGSDIFIAKFNSAGVRQWATYYGGITNDLGISIETDSNGDIIVTGQTGGSLPGTASGFQPTYGGGTIDACVIKINAAGTSSSWATYYGSTGAEISSEVDIDRSNNIIVIGRSSSNNLSTTAGCAQSIYGGGANDAFAIKLNTSGARIWSTYHGGSFDEYGMGIAADANDDVIISGLSSSTNLPVSTGCYQSNYVGGGDGCGYICKLDKNTGAIIWSTYYGTSVWGVEVYGVAVDKANNYIYVSGGAYGNSIPTTSCAYQPVNGAGSSLTYLQSIIAEDFFIARFDDQNGYQLCSTYIGGPGHDDGSFTIGGRIAINNYDVYITGKAATGFPTTTGAYQRNFGGGSGDASVTKICGFSCGENRITTNFSSSTNSSCKNRPIDFTDLSVLCDTANTQWKWTFFGASQQTSTLKNPTAITYPNIGTFDVRLIVITPCGTDSILIPNYITITSPTAIITSITNVKCFGENNGGASVGVIGGQAPLSYHWSVPGNTNSDISGLPSGTYSVIVTDNIGCTSSTTAAITQPQLLTTTVAISSTISCYGGNNGIIGSLASGGTVPYNYLWSNTASTVNITALSANTYSLTITDAYGCSANSNTVIMNEPIAVGAIINPTDALCNGDSTGSISASGTGGAGGYQFYWSINATTNSISTLAAGIYSLTVTDANGCTAINNVNVNEPTSLSLLFNTTDAHCNQNDGAASVNPSGGVGGFTYSWNNGTQSSNNSNIPSGIYSVIVTDANGCTITGSASIANINGVTASISSSNSTTCFGTCDGSATAIFNGGSGPYSFLWSNTSTNAIATGLCAGTFSVVVTDGNGCFDQKTIQISSPNALSAINTLTNTTCYNLNNGSLNINANGGTAPYTFHWSNSNSPNSSQNNLPAGLYSCTITDANQCTITTNLNIVSPPQLIVNITPPIQVCIGNNTNLSCQANGGTPTYNYSWSTGQLNKNILVAPSLNSTYSITITDANGCTVTETLNAFAHPLPVVSFSADKQSGCSELCVNFTNTTLNSQSAIWNYGNNPSSNTGTHCYNDPGSYNVSLTVTDNNGCINTATQNNYITVFPNPLANFSSSANPTLLNNTVYFTDQSIGATQWSWNFGDVISSYSTQQNPSHHYAAPDTGSYKVTLIVSNQFGCMDSIFDFIKITTDFTFYVPNTFTPNGDGVNDLFCPVGTGIDQKQYELVIFDRWGNLIFKSDNPAIGWDGRANGGTMIAQQDVYVWKINVAGSNTGRKRYTGNVNLIK